MIWLKEKNRFAWPWIAVVVFSTLFMVGFDLVWRFVSMSFAQLAMFGVFTWAFGVCLIFVIARMLKKN